MNKKYDVTTEELIAYRIAGHSTKETAEHFNMPKNTVKSRLVHLNIGRRAQQFQEAPEQKADADLKKKSRFFEFAGNYKDSKSSVDIRCTRCGTVFSRNASTIRNANQTLSCPICSKAYVRNTLRVETYMTHWTSEERARIKKQPKPRKPNECRSGPHPCPVCGKITTRSKYCSSDCARKAANAKSDLKKRKFMKDKVIDKDITLKKLFNRDRGVCWICGQMCDYGDYERENGYFVAGNRYPSIDHIIPRCEGGEHSWANIKLAHRICNTDSFKWMRKDSTKRHIAV